MLRRIPRGPTVIATVTNLSIIGITLLASVLVARSLGPSGRGQFATLMAVFALAMVIGELGQSASVTYHAAARPRDAGHVIAAGRRIMTVASVVTCATAIVGASLVLSDSTHTTAYAIALVGCLVNAFGGPLLYGVQARDLSAWNRIRLVQPVTYTLLLAMGFLADRLSLITLAMALVASTACGLTYAWFVARQLGITGGSARRHEVVAQARYGALASSAGIPISLGQNLDKLALTALTSSAFVGNYAVAGSVAALSQPVATAVASVSFPQIAAADDSVTQRRLGRSALIRSLLASSAIALLIATVSVWLVPLVFGSAFKSAVFLVWVLIPGYLLRATNTVMTGMLRGVGQPGAAARAQIGAALAFLLGLVPAVAFVGDTGVGVALALGEGLGLVLGWQSWRRGAPAGRHSR